MSLTDGARGNELQQLRARLAALEAQVAVLPSRFAAAKPCQILRRFNKTTHGFAVGNLVRHNGTTWVKSQADTPQNAHAHGMVVSVPHVNAFAIALPGSYLTGLPAMTAGLNFIHASTAGGMTTTAPTHMRSVFFADSTTSGLLLADGPVLSVSNSTPGSTAAADGDLWFKY